MPNISKKQKEQTRQKIVEAAAEIMSEQGFKQTSMKDIARAAEIGDATIYKYFPTKEDIIIGFYDHIAKLAVEEVEGIDDLNEYNLHEALYVLLDTYIKELNANKDFVDMSVKLLFRNPMSHFKEEDPVKVRFKPLIKNLIEEAIWREEIPSPPSIDLVTSVICEMYLGLVLYWIKDDSRENSKTVQLADLSLALVSDLLRSGLINRSLEIFTFFMKTHFYSAFEKGGGAISKFSSVYSVLRRQSEN